MRFGYDWGRQCFSRFPHAHSNSNCHSNCNRNRNSHSYAHGNGYGNSNGNSNSYCNCDGNADPRTHWKIYADAETTSNTTPSPDTVGLCISSDGLVARYR